MNCGTGYDAESLLVEFTFDLLEYQAAGDSNKRGHEVNSLINRLVQLQRQKVWKTVNDVVVWLHTRGRCNVLEGGSFKHIFN